MNEQRNRQCAVAYCNSAFQLGLILAIVACHVAQAQVPVAYSDSAVLTTILRAEAANSVHANLRIDPRPLKPNATRLYTAEQGAMAVVTPDVVRRRADIIRAIGLRTADTTMI